MKEENIISTYVGMRQKIGGPVPKSYIPPRSMNEAQDEDATGRDEDATGRQH